MAEYARSTDGATVQVRVDADSCPREARRIMIRRTRRDRSVEVRFLARHRFALSDEDDGQDLLELVVTGSVDDALAAWAAQRSRERCAGLSLVVTRDIALAERLLPTGIRVLNDRGDEFTTATIAERRSMSDRARELRAMGLAGTNRARTYGPGEVKAFADSFDRVCATAHSVEQSLNKRG